MTDTNMKAVDSKMFSHVFPLYFNDHDFDDKTLLGKMINWLAELNSFIIVLASRKFPKEFLEDKDGRNLLKESYIHLMKEMQEFF